MEEKKQYDTGHPIVLFDGVCNFCESSVRFIIDRDKDQLFRFSSLQSDIASAMLKKSSIDSKVLSTIVLVEGGKFYTKSTAALRIARKLNGLWPMLYGTIIFPRFVRDAVYDFIAKRRYTIFGKKESCMIPTPEIRARFLN